MFDSKIVQYLILILIIFATGTPIGSVYYAQFSVLIFSLLVLLIIVLNKRFAFKIKIVIVFSCFVLMLLLTMIINQDYDFNHYIGVMLILMSGYLVAYNISFECFVKRFINIMVILSIISIICFLFGILNTGIVNNLPTFYMPQTNQSFKHIVFIYNYCYSVSSGLTQTIYRNAGAFREPGVYQIFLNIALIFELNISNRKRYRVILLLIITVITTASTTGIIAVLLIILPYVFSKNLNKYFIQRIIGISVAIGMVVYEIVSNYEKYFLKFQIGSSSYVSFQERWYGTLQDLYLWGKNILFGVGYSTYVEESVGTANSFSSILALYGIIFSTILFTGLIIFIYKISDRMIGFLFNLTAIMIILVTQNLMLRMFIICLIFFGFKLYRKESKLMIV